MTNTNDHNVSIVIAAYKNAKALSFVLTALARQTVLPRETLVSDDGSESDVREMLSGISSSLPFRLTHIWQADEEFRAARGRNNAIHHATGDIIAFLDQDVLPHKNWLEQHLAHTRRGKLSIGRAMELTQENVQRLELNHVKSGEFETWHGRQQEKQLNALQKKCMFYTFLRRIGLGVKAKPALQTCNASVHRADLLLVNGLDEEYVGWGQEDDNLGRRLYLAGVTPCPLINIALVSHMTHTLCHSEWRQGPNVARFHEKHVSCRSKRGLSDHPHSDVIVTEF